MNYKMSQWSHNNNNSINLQILEKVKSMFNICFNMSNIVFTHMSLKPYNRSDNVSVENHYECVLEFELYRVQFTVNILHITYKNVYTVNKLGIEVFCPMVKKEIEYCCNYLQRQKNLNLLFITLNQFMECIEARRLVVDIAIKNNLNTKVKYHQAGGIVVRYTNVALNVLFGVNWRVQWNTNHSVTDLVEVYYKDFDLPNAKEITDYLVELSHPSLSLRKKVDIWRNLFSNVEKSLDATNSANTGLNNPLAHTVSHIDIDSSDEESNTTNNRYVYYIGSSLHQKRMFDSYSNIQNTSEERQKDSSLNVNSFFSSKENDSSQKFLGKSDKSVFSSKNAVVSEADSVVILSDEEDSLDLNVPSISKDNYYCNTTHGEKRIKIDMTSDVTSSADVVVLDE